MPFSLMQRSRETCISIIALLACGRMPAHYRRYLNYAIDGRRGRRTRIRRIRAHAGGIDCAHAPTHLLDEYMMYMYMYPG